MQFLVRDRENIQLLTAILGRLSEFCSETDTTSPTTRRDSRRSTSLARPTTVDPAPCPGDVPGLQGRSLDV